MHLTRHTDYALRLLIDLAGRRADRVQIAEIAKSQAISRTHLMKIANKLAHAGFIDAQRGRHGGIALARDPANINIGQVVRLMEQRCSLVDCGSCRLQRRCNLPDALATASAAFFSVLDRVSLADLCAAEPQPSIASPLRSSFGEHPPLL